MIIAVDVDDVLAEFIDQVVVFHNERYGTQLSAEDFYTYDYWHVWGGSKHDAIEKMKEFFQSEYFDRINPIAGSLNAIQDLAANHTLFIITSRYDIVAKKTVEWITKHYPGAFKDIHFSFYEGGIGKGALCKKLNVDLIIDDAEKNIIECAQEGVRVLMYDRPWNRHIKDTALIMRVTDWEDIQQRIKKIRNLKPVHIQE